MPVPSGPVRGATGSSGGLSSIVLTFAANPSGTVTILVTIAAAADSVQGVSGLGATWTRALRQISASDAENPGRSLEWWTGQSPSGATATVTVTLSASLVAFASASEWANLEPTPLLGDSDYKVGFTGIQRSVVAPNNNVLVLWGYDDFGSAGGFVLQPGYTSITTPASSGMAASHRIETNASGVTYSPGHQPGASFYLWSALILQGSPLPQQDLTGPHTGPGIGAGIADITGVQPPEGWSELILYDGNAPDRRLGILHRAFDRSWRDPFNDVGAASFRIPEMPALESESIFLSNPIPTGNLLVVTGTARTILPGTILNMPPEVATVGLLWDIWISHNNALVIKQEQIAVRRDDANGATLATFTTPAPADLGDSITGHQFHWFGEYLDTAPTTGRYVITVQEVAGQAGSGSTRIYSDTRVFEASGVTPTVSIADNIVRCHIQGRFAFAFIADAPVKTVASPLGPAGEFWTISGRGLESYLDRAIWYPLGWGAGGPVFPTTVTGVLTGGGWLRRFIDEAKARGGLTLVTTDFTSSVDSAGVPWTQTLDLSLAVGSGGLALVDELRRNGIVIRVTPSLLVQAYQSLGEHREANVVLRQGVHIRDAVPVDYSTGTLRTRMLVQGATGTGAAAFTEVIDTALENALGRRDGFTTGSGAAALEAAKSTESAITVPVLSSLEPGGYHAYFHFTAGDWLAVNVPGVFDRVAIRVVAISIAENARSSYDITLTLGSARRHPLVELAGRVSRLER